MTVRTLEAADAQPDALAAISSRFVLALAGPRPPTHDEAEKIFKLAGKEVKVKEKVRVESADPSLMAAMAKLAALDHTVGMAMKCLDIVMGGDEVA